MNRLILFSLLIILVSSVLSAHPGVGIVMDSQGNVYYTDLTHIWKISPQGEQTIAVPNVHTHELYLDEKDNLYGEHEWYNGEATDTWGNYTWVLSPEGKFTKLKEVEGFLENNTLVRDGTGNSFWSKKHDDYRLVYQQSMNGNNTLYSSHHFDDIRWMYFSKADNHLYIVDNLEIKKIATSGDVEVVADDLKEETPPFAGVANRHYLFGLWTDEEATVYVAVYGAGKVKRIGKGGKTTTEFESEDGWSPCGGLIDPDGMLWVLEFSEDNKTRVSKIDKDGKRYLFGE